MSKGEIFIEFTVQGNFVKATAIHSATGREACIMGPVSSPRAALAQAAVRKLEYVMKKEGG